jgi:hypothetical protein
VSAIDRFCSPRNLCVRCSMIKVVQYRFRAFRQTFGRIPSRDEPLFFDENSPRPEKADAAQVLKHLEKAAVATGIKLPPLLRFLGLE